MKSSPRHVPNAVAVAPGAQMPLCQRQQRAGQPSLLRLREAETRTGVPLVPGSRRDDGSAGTTETAAGKVVTGSGTQTGIVSAAGSVVVTGIGVEVTGESAAIETLTGMVREVAAGGVIGRMGHRTAVTQRGGANGIAAEAAARPAVAAFLRRPLGRPHAVVAVVVAGGEMSGHPVTVRLPPVAPLNLPCWTLPRWVVCTGARSAA